MLRWHAHESSKAVGRIREPISGESFAGIEERANSLLREAIQNSLDARHEAHRPVRVRVYLSGSAGALSNADAAHWFRGAWPHIQADPSLRDFESGARCRFLTIEDFNTVGLQGDLRERNPDENTRNGWCLFFRKEGQSAKSETERGRWGIGKIVFPLCSDARTFLAATVRADDRSRLLMGQSILRSRTVAGTKYLPDLWYCIPDATSGFEMPSEREQDFAALRTTFHLTRNEEPGLSVVIPYLDESITHTALLTAVLKEFFYPILRGSLTVTIESSEHPSITLDSTSLPDEAARLAGTQDALVSAFAALAQWHLENPDEPICAESPSVTYGFDWSDDQLSKDQKDQLNTALAGGLPVHVRVPMPILYKRGASASGHFDVILKATSDDHPGRPVFVRSDLVIPEVKGRAARGLIGLVVAEERGVSTMLGDAENPAHTDWSKHSSNFTPKYKYPNRHLDYVRHSVWNISQALADQRASVAEDALLEFFFLTIEDGDRAARKRRRSGTGAPPTPVTPPSAHPRPFALERSSDGCSVHSTSTPLAVGRAIQLDFAYSVRAGDPLKKYDPEDFDLSRLAVELQGMRVLEKTLNRLTLAPSHACFTARVSGFDQNRDLFVRAREVEAAE